MAGNVVVLDEVAARDLMAGDDGVGGRNSYRRIRMLMSVTIRMVVRIVRSRLWYVIVVCVY